MLGYPLAGDATYGGSEPPWPGSQPDVIAVSYDSTTCFLISRQASYKPNTFQQFQGRNLWNEDHGQTCEWPRIPRIFLHAARLVHPLHYSMTPFIVAKCLWKVQVLLDTDACSSERLREWKWICLCRSVIWEWLLEATELDMELPLPEAGMTAFFWCQCGWSMCAPLCAISHIVLKAESNCKGMLFYVQPGHKQKMLGC